METHLALCSLAGWVHTSRGWVGGAPACSVLLEIFTCPLWNMECRNVHENSSCLERAKSPECWNQRLTNAHSSFPAKLVRTSWTELDLGYPRDRIYIPVWKVLGKFIKLELWGGHSASKWIVTNMYERNAPILSNVAYRPHRWYNYIHSIFSIYSAE